VRGASTVTASTYNPDGTVATRTDYAVSSSASAFSYDWRGNELSATSPLYSGSTTFAWRLDGLIASRSWPTGVNAAVFGYDAAKRPTDLAETLSGAGQATFSQAYDRGGNVTSEDRTISGISGVAGAGSQSFSYDALHRVTGSSLSGGPTQSYAYDANSNRTSWDDGSTTTTYDYNATDELTAQHTTGSDRYYTYDTYGNLTSSAVVLGGTTAYTYDEANHLASITPPAGSASSFSVDALGRQWTKSVGGSLAETYGYAATSDSVVQIDRRSSPYGEP
jgi:YD repeat-containing protein